MTKAIESFEHALELEEYEAAVYLAEIYFTHKEVLNDTKAVHYLDQAIEKTDLPLPKLLLISRYLEDQTILESFVTCKRVYKLMKDIHKIGEINDWYYFGYQKYTMGRFDQALQLFSFASLNGHKMATLAAGYIWEHNLTETLT